MSAAALDQRCEFGTLRQPHADAVDNDVADLVKPILRSQSPLDFDRRAARWANDLARHDRPSRTGSAARHFEGLAVIVCKSLTVDANDIILEEAAKFLLLRLARDPPIRSEHKPGHAWNVEILLQHW